MIKRYTDEEGYFVTIAISSQEWKREWFLNSNFDITHRENNPAIIWKNEDQWYYLNDHFYDANDYWIRLLLMEY